MKKHYLALLAASALLAWNCGDDSNSASGGGDIPPSPSVADLPYYLGGFTIDPATGIVYDAATGIAVGQLLADGTVVSASDGVTPIFACDTTLLPSLSSAGYLINKNGVVTDLNGTLIGNLTEDRVTIRLADGSIVDLAGNVIALPGNDTLSIPQNPDALIVSSASGPDVPGISSAQIDIPVSSAGEIPVIGSSSSAQVLPTSSASVQPGNVTGSLVQNVQKGQTIETIVFSGVASEPTRSWNLHFLTMNYDRDKGTYTISGTVPNWFQEGSTSDKLTIDGKEYTITLHVGNASVKSSSSVSVERSSSSVRSSSSAQVVARSSSSAKSSSSVSGGAAPNIKVVSGGASGSGWATRYWDCCKPSCSWTENAGSGNEARMCTASGSKISNFSEASICNGGSASTCTSQIPIIVNDNLAYAFAAVSTGNGGACGKCFALTFDGTGKYETKAPHQSLKGKVLVVMVSNVGEDVNKDGHFDVMIPGGGVGLFNGCSAFGWGSQGEQYGGLLSDCEKEVGYNKSGSALTSARKSCLTSKCNTVFANDSQAKQGCLFLANWMNAAGNPNHTYQEVECPAALKAQY